MSNDLEFHVDICGQTDQLLLEFDHVMQSNDLLLCFDLSLFMPLLQSHSDINQFHRKT